MNCDKKWRGSEVVITASNVVPLVRRIMLALGRLACGRAIPSRGRGRLFTFKSLRYWSRRVMKLWKHADFPRCFPGDRRESFEQRLAKAQPGPAQDFEAFIRLPDLYARPPAYESSLFAGASHFSERGVYPQALDRVANCDP